jgi:hypothetical protein
MEDKTIVPSSPLLLAAPKDAETFDIHVSYGIYSLFVKKTFFKGEKGRKKKIEILAVQYLIDFLKSNCNDSKKVAEEIEKNGAKKKFFDFRIKNSDCGFPQYKKMEERIRWNAKEKRFEEKTEKGDWIKSKIFNSAEEESRKKRQKRMKHIIRGLQVGLMSNIGDIKYSYLAITNPETAYIGLDCKGKRHYGLDKLEKIFFEMNLLKALAIAVGYNHRNIPAPDIFLMEWF